MIAKYRLRDLILEGEDISDIDYSHITDMSHMFLCCDKLESIPKLDTSNVTDMYGMFLNCSNLKSIPELDTSNVTDMRFMFHGCSNLRGLNIRNFHLYDFSKLDNKFLKDKYPELYI